MTLPIHSRSVLALASCLLAALCLQSYKLQAQSSTASVGIERRVAWTTSRITGSPEAPLPYVTERAFPALKFNGCLDITTAPGSDRLFIVEQAGKIFSFPSNPDVTTPDLVVDLAKEIDGVKEVYALAFHPDFQKNRYCYVCYIKAPNLEDGTHVARFRMSDTNPPRWKWPAKQRSSLGSREDITAAV